MHIVSVQRRDLGEDLLNRLLIDREDHVDLSIPELLLLERASIEALLNEVRR